MSGLLHFPVSELPFVFLVVVISLTIHEFAHAYVADRFGDPTPRSMGRVTLDPRAHLEILGLIMFFLLGFGWAKPVWIKPSNFKNPRLMSILVSVAGPLSNLLLAFVGLLIYHVLNYFNVFHSVSFGTNQALGIFFGRLIYLNMVLFIFNLLPIPPLHGYRIVHEFLPYRAQQSLRNVEQWGAYIFLLFVFIPPLNTAVLNPIFGLKDPILRFLDYVLSLIFGVRIIG